MLRPFARREERAIGGRLHEHIVEQGRAVAIGFRRRPVGHAEAGAEPDPFAVVGGKLQLALPVELRRSGVLSGQRQ